MFLSVDMKVADLIESSTTKWKIEVIDSLLLLMKPNNQKYSFECHFARGQIGLGCN